MSKQELAISTILNLWIDWIAFESTCRKIGIIAPRLIQVHLGGLVNPVGSLLSYNTIVNVPEYKTTLGRKLYQGNRKGTNAGEMYYWIGNHRIIIPSALCKKQRAYIKPISYA